MSTECLGPASQDSYLTKTAVKARYSCSDMWVHRRLADASGFPRPIYIAGRPYWSLCALCAWERSLARSPSRLTGPQGSTRSGDAPHGASG